MNATSVAHPLSAVADLAYAQASVRYLLEAVEPICATCDRQDTDCDPTICEYLRTQIRSLCLSRNGTLPGSSVRPPQWDCPAAVPTE